MLTPIDIKKQIFAKVLRGYDPEEVAAFLETLSLDFEQLYRERNRLTDEVLKLKTQLNDFQQVERTFKDSLKHAQQTIDASKENSQHKARLVVKEAELTADKILEKTKIELAQMKNELLLVKSQKDSFAQRLRHLLQSQLELISVLDIDDLGISILEQGSVASTPVVSSDDRVEFTPISEEEVDFSGDDIPDDVLAEETARQQPSSTQPSRGHQRSDKYIIE